MTLKKNIFANYINQIYVALIGIITLPLYMKNMGAEAYGLIGFFTMLQSWFALLDLGLTPTIGRETARYRAGSISSLYYRQLFRALSAIFIAIALIGGGTLFIGAGFLSSTWLTFSELSSEEVLFAVRIIAICVALRWLGGLFRGVIVGAERLVWLSFFNSFIATQRFIFVFISMWIYGFTPKVFFLHQLGVALCEVLGLYFMGNKLLPTPDGRIGFSVSSVKKPLRFSLSLAFTSAVWVLVTQSDKMILSGLLSLSDYGSFSLAVLVASSILVLNGPISSAIMPRMASLYAKDEMDNMIKLYRNTTKFVATITGPVSLTLASCAEPLLGIWTGDRQLAQNASYILSLYALGNGLLVMAAFPYYLQYARGNMRYHVIGNAITVVLLVPSLIFAAKYFGGVGAGYAWLIINALFAIFWVTYVHSRLAPGLQWRWLVKDWLSIYVPVAITAILTSSIMTFKGSSSLILFQIAVVGMATLLIALIISGYFSFIFKFILNR